jgi:FMN reductase
MGTTSPTRRLAVVTAGLSQPSSTRLLADRLAAATVSALAGQGIAAEVTVLEAREHAQDLVNHLLTGFPSPHLGAAIAAITDADGLIAVTPIFGGSYSGLFKMFIDVLERDSLDGAPAVVAATGGSARHSLAIDHALRPLFAYLHAAVMPTGVFAATDDWGDPEEAGRLAARIEQAARELARAIAARGPRASTPTDPYDDIESFERLLAGDGR